MNLSLSNQCLMIIILYSDYFRLCFAVPLLYSLSVFCFLHLVSLIIIGR